MTLKLPSMRRWWKMPDRGPEVATPVVPAMVSRIEAPVPASPGCERLCRNVALAAEHVESIRTLLEVSEAHEQPIPRAAFQYLDLVSKHLREMERELKARQEREREGDPLEVR